MVRELNRYLASGQLVEIIYLDRTGKTSQRKLKLASIEGNKVKAFCFTRQAIRQFNTDHILAIAPVRNRHVS
ncbi:WYL domain-containing protein [Brevibacillus dissolubilis]|uniref:WYL domain-containing protein n=1 Tax=Brevibacillus dissolubilis TaxID=1844116 RepID=UPI0011178E2B|nr:WYL domain-containing protein [Brevibacillus dissolubilis]